MTKRILVTYATRAGSTREVAAAIGESLSRRGYAVDVRPVKERPDPAGYQAVILGSAIRMGKWLPEAIDYVSANQAALGRMPVALFTVHLLNTGEDDASQANCRAYLDAVRPLLNEPEEIFFTGAMDYARLSFLDRTIARMVGSSETDQRDWEQIEAWTPAALA